MKVVPPEYRQDAHHWLILHGRYTCVARKPACPRCAVADLCEFKAKTPPPPEFVPHGAAAPSTRRRAA
jgi:endonuclease-3